MWAVAILRVVVVRAYDVWCARAGAPQPADGDRQETFVERPISAIPPLDEWLALVSPAWVPAFSGQQPPRNRIVGGWPVSAGGAAGPFQPNPGYVPADDSEPTDPIDAILWLIAGGERLVDDLVSALRRWAVVIACDEQDRPTVVTAPNGSSCVMAATAEVQKLGVTASHWMSVLGVDLPDIVPAGVDILLNPNGSAPSSLRIDLLREES
ncbi:type VII secretion system-associated protein [Nocardia sp. NPDC049149]|uniref:type VII secretion system-associated protein n=1 Tax=Nocardia sp. NPDC049149 TaxID=3364315 RepID=UPI003718E309